MESPPSSPTKLKLWRWLLLLSVITVALGGFVWWKSRSERLQFVETIWMDSQGRTAVGTKAGADCHKIGEMWELTESRGVSLFGRGRLVQFERRYPTFTRTNAFQQDVLTGIRGDVENLHSAVFRDFAWSEWWDRLTKSKLGKSGEVNIRKSFEPLFIGVRAMSLREHIDGLRIGDNGDHGRNYAELDGELRLVEEVADLFDDSDWLTTISAFVLTDLRHQGLEGVLEPLSIDQDHIAKFYSGDFNNFAITPDGVWFYFSLMINDDKTCKVFVPTSTFAKHLRPDGPHRLFQTNVSK